jgi:hypothetical protein
MSLNCSTEVVIRSVTYVGNKGAEQVRIIAKLVLGLPDKAKFLEIGIGNGACLRFVHELRPDVVLCGIDDYSEPDYGPLSLPDKAVVFTGEQAEITTLLKASERGPFDMIVDDGSHFSDGVYCIEDLHVAKERKRGTEKDTIEFCTSLPNKKEISNDTAVIYKGATL